MKKLISVVIPAYNEEDNIPNIVNKIEDVFQSMDYKYEIILVDDGSKDKTYETLKNIALIKENVFFIEFSRNFGKDQALKAGIDNCRGDLLITLDADMQHPPELMKVMVKKWEEGYEIVYAFRESENPDAKLKNRIGSKLFYTLLNYLSDIKVENGIADYRLMDKKAVEELKKIGEYELFLRGMIKWIGFRQIGIPYTPDNRTYGNSNYSITSLIYLALHGVTSFSIKPLYGAVYLGFTFSLASIIYLPYVLYSHFAGLEVSGWASLIMTIVFFGGLQLIILGIIGIYVGKMFMQTKNRPNYIIRSTNLKPILIDTTEL